MKRQLYTKKQLINILKEFGIKDINLTYFKSEGWWLECEIYDDWLSMDSFGAMLKIKQIILKNDRVSTKNN